MGSTAYSETYTYNDSDGSLNTMTTGVGTTLTMGYDGLRRLSTVTGGPFNRSYAYRDISSTATTLQVSQLSYPNLGSGVSFGYTYDSLGNIATYTAPDGEVITYSYDNQGQLLKAEGDATYLYVYDSVGNILTANGHTYTYGNANWKDLLTAFDGNSITYDASGNPTSYYNGTRWNFTWANGRSLATATDGTNNLSFTYDTNGLRTSKKVGTVTHKYLYASGKLMRETYGGNTLDFFYDANGTPYALKYNGTVYYYVTNLQGDVIRVVDANGNTVASYNYDPYGKVISATGTLAGINPIRYRGYYYDTETGFYYLQSRYYDPAVGRFINADSYSSTGQGIIGHNMFAYCNNNPVMDSDPSGELLLGAMIGGAVGGALLSVVSHITTNPDATVGSTLIALGVGAVTGAIGGVAGFVSVNRIKWAYSLAAGVVSGIYAGVTSSGSVGQKILTGLVVGAIATGSTYLGSKIETTGADRFTTAVTNYAMTVLVGSFAEPVSYGAQQLIAGASGNKSKPQSRSTAQDRQREYYRRKLAVILGISEA